MFHRLRRFPCPPLEKLNEIARLTAVFALERQDCRTEDEINDDFVAYFAENGHPKVGPWLWGKPKAIREPLLKLLQFPVTAKASILAAVTADADFEGCFGRGQLQSSTLTYT